MGESYSSNRECPPAGSHSGRTYDKAFERIGLAAARSKALKCGEGSPRGAVEHHSGMSPEHAYYMNRTRSAQGCRCGGDLLPWFRELVQLIAVISPLMAQHPPSSAPTPPISISRPATGQ
jgi:hypothetical protein